VIRLPAAAASAAAVGVSLLLAGCVDPPPVCTAPAGHAMLVAELFFGRSIAPAYQRELGATVSDTQWAAFARTVLTPAFPDGLTAVDAHGQWRDPSSSVISREPATLVIVAAPDTDKTRQGLSNGIAQYRVQFHQQSVGLILRHECASF
jgi:hypothetical protein